MSYRLYVRPVPPFMGPDQLAEDQLFNWVLHDAGGDSQARGTGDSRDTIEQTLAQNAIDNVQLIGLIPGDEALFCLADIPAKQSRFINQALPFAVEEQIAQDIEAVHLALGRHTEDGYQVAAIDVGRMTHWVSLFRGWAYAKLEGIYPDAALLPATAGGWSVCLTGALALIISDRGEWLSMQSGNLGLFAQTLAVPSESEVITEVPITLYATEDEFEVQQSAISELTSPGVLSVHREMLELIPLELLAHAYHHRLCQPINLCQGNFSSQSNKSSPLKPWKPLIAVASIWFCVQVALELGMGFYYQNQTSEVNQQVMAIYHQAFPDDRRTPASRVRRTIEGYLRAAGSSKQKIDFITLMKYTGEQYAQLSRAGSVTFNSVNFSRARGELVVDIRADSYEKLSALRNGLSKQGLSAQIGSVVNESNGARGRLTVSGG